MAATETKQPPVVRLLKAARRLIGNKKRWTKGKSAADKKNYCVAPTSRKAVRWCAYGALLKQKAALRLRENVLERADSILDAASQDLTERSNYVDVNDKLGRDRVLEVFDEAIKRAEAA